MGEIVLEDCYNDEDEDYDSEDSNQENYYTNDYPDDEEAALGSDDELCRQMNNFMFGKLSKRTFLDYDFPMHMNLQMLTRTQAKMRIMPPIMIRMFIPLTQTPKVLWTMWTSIMWSGREEVPMIGINGVFLGSWGIKKTKRMTMVVNPLRVLIMIIILSNRNLVNVNADEIW